MKLQIQFLELEPGIRRPYLVDVERDVCLPGQTACEIVSGFDGLPVATVSFVVDGDLVSFTGPSNE